MKKPKLVDWGFSTEKEEKDDYIKRLVYGKLYNVRGVKEGTRVMFEFKRYYSKKNVVKSMNNQKYKLGKMDSEFEDFLNKQGHTLEEYDDYSSNR